MIEFGLNDKLMDIDASFKENRIDFAMAGLAFTLLDNNVPICSGGIIPTWMGNAQGWAIASKRIFRNKIKAARLIKKRMPFFPDRNHFHYFLLDNGLSNKNTISLIVTLNIIFGIDPPFFFSRMYVDSFVYIY